MNIGHGFPTRKIFKFLYIIMGKVMRRNIIQSFFIVILGASSGVAWTEGTIYKCQNQQGAMIYQKSACNTKAETVTSWIPVSAKKPSASESEAEQDKHANKKDAPVFKLKQNSRGHYSTEASINDKSLTFVVDTGASVVSLPETVAHDAKIYCDDKVDMNTANGATDGCSTKIKKLQFGPFIVNDVAAVIMPKLSLPLLGMNVLQLFKIAQEKGEMHISYQENSSQAH
jgi:clan AA aspartic protease (TIGR02281 family)